MAYATSADNIETVEELLDGAGAGPGVLGSLADTAASDVIVPDGFWNGRGPGAEALGAQAWRVPALGFLTGTEVADTLLGGEGTDIIDARGGDDVASGFGGGDLLLGGAGDDDLTGDSSFVPGGPSYPTQTAGDDTILGGAGNDTITGDDFRATAFGTTSNLLFGGAGDDVITAGFGADTVNGGTGDDLVLGYGNTSGLGGSAGASAPSNDLGDLLSGGAGNDTIRAGGGDDTVDGGAGNDSLVGGSGIDALTGGAGADRFVFAFANPVTFSPDTGSGEGNRDVVTDFRSGQDLLDLSGYSRVLNLRWDYDAAGDRTVVTYEDPRGAAFFPDLQIELTGVRDLGMDDFVLPTPAAADVLA